jgi:hypothetical protein
MGSDTWLHKKRGFVLEASKDVVVQIFHGALNVSLAKSEVLINTPNYKSPNSVRSIDRFNEKVTRCRFDRGLPLIEVFYVRDRFS